MPALHGISLSSSNSFELAEVCDLCVLPKDQGMKNLNDYLDDFDMIVTLVDRDGGDSCAHGCAILYAAVRLEDISTEALLGLYTPKLEVDSGLYCRHPDKTKWYSHNDTFSRDQLTPLIALLGIRQQYAALRRLFRAHMKHLLLFAWNTRNNDTYQGEADYAWKLPDITFIDILGMYIRGFDVWALYPLLLLCDVPTLIGSLIYRLKLSSSTIQMNQVIMVDYANTVMRTPVAWLAKKVYGKETPKAALVASWGPAFQPPVDEYLTRLIDNNW